MKIELMSRLPSIKGIGLLFILAKGMIIFRYYRIIFSFFEYLLFYKCNITPFSILKNHGINYFEAQVEFYINRQSDKMGNKLSDYLHLLWAILHYKLITTLLYILSTFFKSNITYISGSLGFGIGIVLLVSGGLAMNTLFRIEKEILGKLI